MKAQYDAYVANEVFPFIDSVCQRPASDSHAAAIARCLPRRQHPLQTSRPREARYALSGIYDMRYSHGRDV